MPRIRTIKPDAFLSESLSTVPRGTRWTFAGLWTYADDRGRGRDDTRLIKAALYPLDDDVSLADVNHDLELLEGIDAICRYVVDGRRYLHMPNWEHQKINRPTPAKSPECPIHEGSATPPGVLTDDSVSPHGALTEPSTWEKEGKGREVEREREREVPDRAATGATTTALAIAERTDVDRVCEHLADRIEANGSKRPTIGKGWRDAARLMLDADGRTEEEVHGAIDWCQADEFWRANILSMPKLREKYDQLRMQAQRRSGSTSRNEEWRAMQERQMARAVEREREMGLRP